MTADQGLFYRMNVLEICVDQIGYFQTLGVIQTANQLKTARHPALVIREDMVKTMTLARRNEDEPYLMKRSFEFHLSMGRSSVSIK